MSKVITGILLSIGVPLLVQFGFSDACSGEITGKIVPIIAMLPGAFMAWKARVGMGGVSRFGIRK